MRIPPLALCLLSLAAPGCACATAEVCLREAQQAVAEPPIRSASANAHALRIVALYERACELGSPEGCRSALGFWSGRLRTRASGPLQYYVEVSGAAMESWGVELSREVAEQRVTSLLARLITLEVASARETHTRAAWVAVATEFPNTDASAFAQGAEDDLIVAELGPSAKAADLVRELPAARPKVLQHIEQRAAGLSLESLSPSEATALARALRAKLAESKAAERLLDHADDAAFAQAKALCTTRSPSANAKEGLPALRAYLATYPSGRHASEAVTLEEEVELRALETLSPDPRVRLASLQNFLKQHAGSPLRNPELASSLEKRFRDEVRVVEATEAMAEGAAPGKAFAFFDKYPTAPEAASVRAALAKRLNSSTDTLDTEPYDTFLKRFPKVPEAGSVRTSLAAVKRRIAQAEATERAEAAKAEAQRRNFKSCFSTCYGRSPQTGPWVAICCENCGGSPEGWSCPGAF